MTNQRGAAIALMKNLQKTVAETTYNVILLCYSIAAKCKHRKLAIASCVFLQIW